MTINKNLSNRVKEVAEYIVENYATVRQTAEEFGISKSTVHKYVTKRILDVDSSVLKLKAKEELYEKVRIVLDYNASQRAIRGGMATREKYKK